MVVGIAEPVFFQIRNHPSQYVYFSPPVGGPRAAFGRYKMDYWGNLRAASGGMVGQASRARADARRVHGQRLGGRRG